LLIDRKLRRGGSGVVGVAAPMAYVFLWASAFVPSRILARSARHSPSSSSGS